MKPLDARTGLYKPLKNIHALSVQIFYGHPVDLPVHTTVLCSILESVTPK